MNETDNNTQPVAAGKSRVAYIVLAIFLGCLGVHNFYAGYNGKGIIQLLISLFSGGFLALGVWVWVIVEIITTDKDANGVPFV